MFNVGVDIGGTKIAIGLVSLQGEIQVQRQFPTHAERGTENVILRLIQEIDGMIVGNGLSYREINAIGVGVPGTVDLATGEVILAPNIHWRHIPLGERLREAFPGLRISADYDSNAAALGEFMACGDPTVENMFYITISTGIGSGIIIDRRLYRGKGNTAGEIGHIVMENNGRPCTCGNRGCLQEYAKGPAIVAVAEQRMAEGEDSELQELVNAKTALNPQIIADAARRGDPLACSVLLDASKYVGLALAHVIGLINPDLIVIGGGVARIGPLFLDPIIEEAQNHCYPPARERVRIKISERWEKAGIVGASLLHTTLE